MKYYVTTDVHGFYSELRQALTEAGFFSDEEPHKLIILGDLFDRGREAKLLQQFVLDLMEKGEVILIRGNHEDLFVDMVTSGDGIQLRHHVINGTYNTAIQLTDFDPAMADIRPHDFAVAAQNTPYFQKIIPSMLDYYETDHFVFVHGWIPCIQDLDGYSYYSDWRSASADEWAKARWYNGIDAAVTAQEEKTIVCGHWHASYGHSKYEGKCSEFGDDADFTPYQAPGIIAMDACTARSGFVNVLVLDD